MPVLSDTCWGAAHGGRACFPVAAQVGLFFCETSHCTSLKNIVSSQSSNTASFSMVASVTNTEEHAAMNLLCMRAKTKQTNNRERVTKRGGSTCCVQGGLMSAAKATTLEAASDKDGGPMEEGGGP